MMKSALPLVVCLMWATIAAAQTNDVGAAGNIAPTIAQATAIPNCTTFVDANATTGADGSAGKPHKTIADAVASASPGAIICVAEGIYPEKVEPDEKPLTLAGGFQRGSNFSVRDSARFVSRAQGDGSGSFLRVADLAPTGDKLTAIDGFEITGYERAIVREYWESQRFDITNNSIHDNVCTDLSMAGAAFALANVSGTISGNTIVNNSCGRGGGGFINDDLNQNTVTIENNLIDGNAGAEPDSAHGGGLYLFTNRLIIRGNVVVNNRVSHWGGGIYIGAYKPGGQVSNAELSWNVYRGNQAGDSGGGFFCDDGASCTATHEIYDRNCGGNVLVDGGAEGSGPTLGVFTNITNVGALSPDCKEPGIGFWMDTWESLDRDNYTISNAIFWGNGEGEDLAANCGSGCDKLGLAIDNSLVQPTALEDGYKVKFGPNLIAPADPLFAGPADFQLGAGSPAAGKGADGSDLGAFGGGASAADIERLRVLASIAAERTGGASSAPKASTPVAVKVTPPVLAASSAEPRAAPNDNPAVRSAFEAARELGTPEAWNAFLQYYPTGYYAALAKGYLVKLGQAPATAAAPVPAAVEPTAAGSPAARREPAVARAGDYMGFPEQFNRYYTDPAWTPEATVYVGPSGGGDGYSQSAPMMASEAVAAAKPGTLIVFTRGNYEGGFEFTQETSGTYDQPIVVLGERNEDGSIGVTVDCTKGMRQVCFNMEQADYVAIDGFELVGGKYGIRSVGTDYAQSLHAKGIAALNSIGHDQERDPFFTGHSDWAVFEGNVAYAAKKGDGHGFYISNGGDWNIVRFNETYGNISSDFQINADPMTVCEGGGIAFDDPRCDAYAGEGEGGQGASDYMLVDGNYFHHGAAGGANFTGVRRSVVRNNVFGPQTRHNVSFWQETDNPKLGSSDNLILHNLFVTNGSQGIQFINNSTRNIMVNNLLLGIKVEGGQVVTNPSAVLMEVDDTVSENEYAGNVYVSGKVEGRQPGDNETVLTDFSAGWFANFPGGLNHDPADLMPTADAPFLGVGTLHTGAPLDARGNARSGNVDIGPFENP